MSRTSKDFRWIVDFGEKMAFLWALVSIWRLRGDVSVKRVVKR